MKTLEKAKHSLKFLSTRSDLHGRTTRCATASATSGRLATKYDRHIGHTGFEVSLTLQPTQIKCPLSHWGILQWDSLNMGIKWRYTSIVQEAHSWNNYEIAMFLYMQYLWSIALTYRTISFPISWENIIFAESTLLSSRIFTKWR